MMKRLVPLLLAAAVIAAPAIPLCASAAGLRIGVFGLFHPAELALAPAPHGALLVRAGNESLILEDGQHARCRVARDQVECRAGERLIGGPAIRVTGRAGGETDFTLSVPGKIVRNYRGRLEISAEGKEILAVVVMDLEVAVASAVAAESPPGAPLEALKAQAVVTRSYYLAARHRHRHFDFCDTTHCQFLREPPPAGSPPSTAAALTRGVVLLYRGAVLPALFCASCGGRTRTLREIGLKPRGYPYYSVACPVCLLNAQAWRVRLGREQAAGLVAREGSELARLRLDRRWGWETVPGNNYSMKFEGGSVVLDGRGAGHGLGLCQMGAAGMARQGSTFAQILAHYFPNTTLGNSPSTPVSSPSMPAWDAKRAPSVTGR
jgi:stage II sporulation protein D (peptidoglycan lytic transglycosylase)